MREGWAGDKYVIFFDDGEIAAATARYKMERFLPGHTIVGLLGWDDLIVQATDGTAYTVPSVRLAPQEMEKCGIRKDQLLEPDLRLVGKIKWYTKPIVFGGDPNASGNMTWVTHEQHGELVVWWNAKYKELGGA